MHAMRDRLWRVAALLSYVVLALLVIGRPLISPNIVTGVGVDLPGTLWMHGWVRLSTLAGEFPVSSNLLFYPEGKNFFNATGANFIDAYLSIPFQWIWGVPDYLDWFEVAVLVGNALCFEALARELSGGRLVVAWACALAFEVNPFVLTELSQGRPTQAMVWFLLLAVRSLVRLPTGSSRDAVLFGLYATLQGLTYWFTLYFLVLGLLPVALVHLLRSPRKVAPRLVLAMAVTLLLVSPFLYRIHAEMLAGRVPRTDVADWHGATEPERWHRSAVLFTRVTVGALVVAALLHLRRAWPWLLGFVLTLGVAAGSAVGVGAVTLENPIYGFLWEFIPFFRRLAFPERISAIGFVVIVAAGAVGLSRVRARWSVLVAMLAFGELFGSGLLPLPVTAYPPSRAEVLVRDGGGAVIGLPFGLSELQMVSQARHGQPLFGGMGEGAADLYTPAFAARLDNTFVLMLAATDSDAEPRIGYTSEDREAIVKIYRWVWLERRRAPSSGTLRRFDPLGRLRRLTEELGAPVYSDGRQVLWDLRAVPVNPPGLGSDVTLAGEKERALIVPTVRTVRTVPTPRGSLPPPRGSLPR